MTMTKAIDYLLPDNWYDHHTQAQLILAGIKYPVYTNALKQVFPEGTQLPSAPIVYVPHFGDLSFDHLGDNVLANENSDNICILVTPPIPGFNYDKFIHGIFDENQDQLPTQGYLPHNFVDMATHTIKISFDALHAQLYQIMDSPPPYTVLGAKLSPLSSGKANVALFIKFNTYDNPFVNQSYYDIPGHNLKIRIIPKPIITINKFTKLHELHISFDILNPDNQLFQHAHQVGSIIIPHDIQKYNFKHAKVNNGNKVVLVAHSTTPINNHNILRSIQHKISLAMTPYIANNFNIKTM